MKLPAYLSPSRHGVYYFRWPLPIIEGGKRQTLRISLKTKCPDRAGDLAKYMASCGILIRDNKTLTRLRQDEVRAKVRSYFVKVLDGYVERLNDTGWKKQELEYLEHELEIHEDGIANFDDMSDLYLDAGIVDAFRASAGISEAEWAENEPDIRRELRKARRDQIKAFLSRSKSLEHYNLTNPPIIAQEASQPRSAPLRVAVNDFMAEHSVQWSDQMVGKARGFLVVLLEYFGEERPMGDISRHDASELKKVVQALPVNRNTKPETKGLPLLEAVEVQGVRKVSIETVNNHMAMFFRFWDWAERHGHAPQKLFEGMKVAKSKQTTETRKPYTREQTTKLYAELTLNHSGLVKKDDHKWGALLGLYTGARLREISQLDVKDVKQEGDIWFIDINDDGANKSLKTVASCRQVPLHSDLIQLGFIDWIRMKPHNQRLFMTFSHNVKEGYGRSLGRWFNTRFLVDLDMKEAGLVFHSLRHTMVTRLAQAGVPEPLYQEIVGHERQGVSQQVYFKEGHTLTQKKEAIELFEY